MDMYCYVILCDACRKSVGLAIFEEIGTHLKDKKLLMKEGPIVDVTIIKSSFKCPKVR